MRRRVVHPRSPWRSRLERWLGPLQRHGGLILLGLSIAATTVLLYTLPMVWVRRQLDRITTRFQDSHWQQFQEVHRHWSAYAPPPPFKRGDEPELRAWLEAHPLVSALADRQGRMWKREGDRVVSAPGSPESAWVRAARRAGSSHYPVPPAANPEHGRGPALVLLGEPYVLVKAWKVGSPEVEAALQRVLAGAHPFRVGLRPADPEARHPGPMAAWSGNGRFQADFPKGFRSPWEIVGTDEVFGEGWELAALPSEADQIRLQAIVDRESRVAWIAYAVVVLALSAGLYLRHRARQRERVESDRLAAMAHSLKTPLAVLKLRCDSLRLGALPPDRAEAHLLRIGSEVEGLLHIIEGGLESLRGQPKALPREPLGRGFYQTLADDFAATFALEDRRLDFHYEARPHEAHAPSLRTALVTLLENALAHGGGPVAFQVASRGGLTELKVRDEGDGLDTDQMDHLGRPYQRYRREGEQGFLYEGQGLGLSLLVAMARQEGWGLEFASRPGQGFEAVIELPE